MHVLLVEPAFPKNQSEFARALHQVGAHVTGIGESPADALPDEVKRYLHGYEQVQSVVDEGALLEAVRRVQAREWVDRLEATVEAHVMAAAHVRETTDIPGTLSRTAFLCRDKPAMKEVLREAGVPCAQSIGSDSADELRSFVDDIGYPVILKPLSAAGAADTFKATGREELERALDTLNVHDGRRVAVEEFIEGHEGFYDTLTIEGRVTHEFITHYFPGVLESMRARWISPFFATTNRIDAETYTEVKELGRRVNEVLGIHTSATHMEWFFGPKGLKFSEIGCRPPGVCVWDLYSAANDFDLYVEWAKAVCYGTTDGRPSRRCSAAMMAMRPDRDGVISGYEGFDQVQHEFGQWIHDAHLPPEGTPTQPVEAGYMANAWMRMLHPDYDDLCAMMDRIGEMTQVRAR